jgi:hypothetical protein
MEIIYFLAVFRLTSLLHGEEGPYGLFEKIRAFVSSKAFDNPDNKHYETLEGIFSCFWCCSVWAAIILYPFYLWGISFILIILAASAVAIFINTITEKLL